MINLNYFIVILLFTSVFELHAREVGSVIKVNLNSIGELELLEEGQIVTIVDFEKNFKNWYHEVRPISDQGEALTTKPVKIAQKYILKYTSLTLQKKLQAVDDLTGEEITLPQGQKYLIIESDERNYFLHLLDENFEPVDHKGNHPNRANFYKANIESIDNDINTETTKSVAIFDQIKDLLSNVNKNGCKEIRIPKFGQPGYYFNKYTPIHNLENPYEYMLRNRRRFRRMGRGKCLAEKEKLEDEVLQKRNKLYANITFRDKANYLLGAARGVYDQLLKMSKETEPTKDPLLDFGNGYILDPVVTPELATCIAYQETYGRLNPYSLNYTSCNRGIMNSTAHGVAQITESAIKNLRDHPSEEHLPLHTEYSKNYQGLDDREVHRKMSGDIHMSFEVMMRILSANAKRTRLVRDNITEEEVLRKAVYEYDQDNSSKYIINVIEKCLPCMNSGEDGIKQEGYKCYESMQ